MRRFLQFTLSLCLMLVALTAHAEKSPYTLTYDKTAELLKLVKEGCTSYEATYVGQATLEGYDGFFSFNPADPDWTFMGNTCIAAYVVLPDGDYTLKVAAGTYKFDGVENEAFEIPFTVGEKQQGGGEAGEFDGEKWQETLYKAGETAISVPVTFETEGVSITTVGREFMGTTIDVAYNEMEENEIDWKNGTKLVITAKDNISGIVIDGQFVAFASADKGVYSNGKWTGSLMKGETLTLTSNDGIYIKKLVVLYNGDEYNAEEEDVNAGKISIAYPVADQLVASIADRGKLATFTTTKEYEQVIINIDDEDEAFNNIYKFPTRMVDNAGENSDNLHVGENTITASTPDGKTYYFFKGHTYTMTIKGYVHMYDVMSDTYDAVATVKFVGDGKEAEKLSDITIDKIFPKNGTVLPEGPRTVDITFSAPVKTLRAVMPKGMEGSTTYSCTKVDEAGLSWNVNLGDLTVVSEGGEESGMTLEISGTDVDGNVLNLGVNAAHALILSYTISKNAQEPEHEANVEIVPAFLNGEDEITLNDHSSVSVEKANALKVTFGDNAAKIKYATYSVNELVEEEFMGVTDVVENEIASGLLALNTVGYAEFEEAIKFFSGSKYNVYIKAWDTEDIMNEDWTVKEPIAKFTCEFNGAYSEESGAALVVDGETIALSTETATEFGELPAGSVFKYVVTKEDTKTVQFQIYDVTAGEIIKTMAMKQDANGLSGVVEFPLAIQYDLAKGHEYEAQFKEYNAVNGLTIKAPTATANYKFTGVADVTVYSTVKVASIAPSTSEDINDLDTPVVITFTDAIASLDVTAVIGQMSAVAVDAANITPNEDKTVWTVTLDRSYVSSGTIQLNFYAIDNEGNRVTDPNNGVGTPETCYVNYSWATTIGFPTPTLAENGKTYETVEAITFEYEGIGLNENNANATWKDITIEKDGAALNLAITEDMFKIAGDESVGGTKLILSLPTLYKGVYTVKVPARAFMLGHDTENTYNGACTFTFTCTAEEEAGNTIDIAVERMVGLGYEAANVEFDGAAVLGMLGLTEWNENEISVYPIDPTTGEQVTDYDGWRNDQGVPTAWGDAANGACLKYPHLENGAYIMTLCTFPGRDTEAGKVLPAQWAVNNKATGKTVILNVAITLVAAPELSFEVVKTVNVPVYITPAVAYEGGNTATFDLADAVEALGVESAADIKEYILNADGAFVANTTDGWRNAEGFAAGWATSASMVCTKVNVADGQFFDIMAIDDTYAEGSKYTSKWALTANGKAVVYNVNITFGEPLPELAEGTYVIMNVASGRFLNGSNSWGTKASTTEHGQFMTIAKLEDGTYTIDSHYSNGGDKHYLAAGDNTFLDALPAGHVIEYVGDFSFTIKDSNGKYLSDQDGLVNFNADEVSEASMWMFASKEDLVELSEDATEEDPFDFSALVPDANFSRNNQDINLWEGESKMGKGGPNGAEGATTAGMNAEKWGGNSTSIDFHTTIADLPNGYYVINFQGFYRYNNTTDNTNDVAAAAHADGTEVIAAKFSANDVVVPFMSICDETSVETYGKMPFSQAEASEAFSLGAYKNTLCVEVVDGTLTLAVTKNEADHVGCDWTILDNIELYYVGAEKPAVAINSVAASAMKANGKYIENGKVVIVKNGVKYNVAGSVIK